MIREQFPDRRDISNDEMEEAIRDALAVDGELPCTLIVLDEVQQYIGDSDAQGRAHSIQQVGRLHVKSLSEQDLLQVRVVPTGGAAFVLHADLDRLVILQQAQRRTTEDAEVRVGMPAAQA